MSEVNDMGNGEQNLIPRDQSSCYQSQGMLTTILTVKNLQ
jgi:hypothetical protein